MPLLLGMVEVRVKSYYIYVIERPATGEVYIGQSDQPKVRWGAHRSELKYGKHRNPHLQASWKKHGPGAFVFYLLDELPTREAADEMECRLIGWYRELDLCYNVNPGGETRSMTPEGKARMITKLRGQKRSEESRRRVSEGQRGRTLSEETRSKIGAASRRKVMPLEARQRISESLRGNQRRRGKSYTPEQIARRMATPGNARVTESQVLEIRERFARGGITRKQLAEDYHMSTRAVSALIQGVTWKHLPLCQV